MQALGVYWSKAWISYELFKNIATLIEDAILHRLPHNKYIYIGDHIFLIKQALLY